jgi:hypothetical protein
LGEDAVETGLGVEPFAREAEEILGVEGGDVGPEFDDEGSFAGFELDAGERGIGHGCS